MKTNHVKMLLSAMVVFLIAWGFSACSSNDSTPKVVKTDLIAAVAAANTLISTTHEGVGTGDYLKGSQAPLIAAIEQAQLVVDNATATKAQVTAATANLAAAVATYQSNQITPIDPTNLVGQWTFDEITSTVADATVKDYSGNSRNGSLKAGHVYWGGSGVPTLTADRYGNAGKALHFDKGQNVEVPYNTALNPSVISISLWMKQDVNDPIINNQYMVALNRWNCYKLNMQDSPRSFFTVNPAETPGSYYNEDNNANLAQGSWYHVVVTFGGGKMTFYTNGVLSKEWAHDGTVISQAGNPINLTFGQDLPTSAYTLTEGDFYVNWGGFFVGALDEIRIYKSVLTATQVTSIYNAEKP